MSEEIILVNVTPRESRVAWLDNGVLQEIWIERYSRKGLVGNIYKGKVVRVLPGMQAAFVDIGLEKAGFLHVDDLCVIGQEVSTLRQYKITELLQEGQSVVVQVTKDPIGSKGARVTMQITLASRYLVYLPMDQHIGVSSRIELEAERQRLKETVHNIQQQESIQGAYILRTASEGASSEALRQDMIFLKQLWNEVILKAKKNKIGLIKRDLPLYLRVLRDIPTEQVGRIQVDSRETFHEMVQFAKDYVPELAGKILRYDGDSPIFELYAVEDEIQKALEQKVHLKSGGYLIFDQTEALTTVDVNTGGFVGHLNLESTIFQTNLEAAQAIARQLRLRNLGGIIIIDFIDMDEAKHRQMVIDELTRRLEKDRNKPQVVGMTALGLMEVTRKRNRESLERTLCEPCPICHGRGYIRNPETMINAIFREITRYARQFPSASIMVLAHESIVHRIEDDESESLAELESFIGSSIRFQAENIYPPDQFDVVAK